MAVVEGRRIVVGGAVRRELEVDDRGLRSRTLELAGRRMEIESVELEVALDASQWRHDIPDWRWTKADAGGEGRGYHLPDFDDATWSTVPHLHPLYDTHYDGRAWFRHGFELPRDHAGEPVRLVLGGMDDEDWCRYRVYLNGVLLDGWSGTGRWRSPHTVAVEPGGRGYDALSFGGSNVLAVEATGLERAVPRAPEEAEHFMHQGWLVDQAVVVGEPFRYERDFRVLDVREDGAAVEIDVAGQDLAATVAFAADPHGRLRKSVRLTNRSAAAVRVLEVASDDVRGSFDAPTKGGRGLPVLAGSCFAVAEHTAAIAQGEPGRIRSLLLLGRDLEPGESISLPATVYGTPAAGETVEASFRRYVSELRPRRSTRVSIYSALGWTDFASESGPRPHLTQELFEQTLERLEELRADGVGFDLYEFDDWCDPGDFSAFDRERFPAGAAALAELVRRTGMGVALWSATTQAIWTSNAAPGVGRSIAGGVARTLGWEQPPEAVADWDWDAVFARVATGQMRYCWASEPFRTLIRESLVQLAGETAASALKLDCTVLHCTSADHDHLPGKYSVWAIHDAVRGLIDALRAVVPELFVIWYWGFQSPLWLGSGDLMFDKALKLEAASPASVPAASWRAGVTLNSDQAVAHAELVPLHLQDSLGVWLGHVPWANWMGADGWRDAFVVDVARGSTLVSLWGDLWLLDSEDVGFLRRVLTHVRESERWFRETTPIGGDPWLAEPYGYMQPLGSDRVATVFNPSFVPRPFVLPSAAAGGIWEMYPVPGLVATPSRAPASILLAPWEVRMLRLLAEPGALVQATSSAPRPTQDLALLGPPRRTAAAEEAHLEWRGEVPLPELADGDEIAVVVRLSRRAAWRYDPEPQARFALDLTLDGKRVAPATIPATRSWNGPGCPWVVYRIPTAASWSGCLLRARLSGRLPSAHDATANALVYDAVAVNRTREFQARPEGPV